jgi:hypothetical protein
MLPADIQRFHLNALSNNLQKIEMHVLIVEDEAGIVQFLQQVRGILLAAL